MSNKLAIAFGALLVIVGVTVWQFKAEEAGDRPGTETALSLPTIEAEKVDGLTVSAPGKTKVVLKKSEDGWHLTEPLSAMASQSALEAAVDKLAELEVTSVAATKPENHARLEVTSDKAVHVIAKQGDAVLADLWIGTYRTGNTMVRKEGETRVASVKGSIRYAFEKDVKDWRDRAVTDMDSEQVARITLETPQGNVVLERSGDTFKQAAGTPPIERFDEAKAKAVVSSVARLSAVDFAAPDVTPDAAGTATGTMARVTLELAADAGESTVLLKVGNKVDNRYYLQREGTDVIYAISTFVGDRLSAGPKEFIKPEESKAAAAQPPLNPHGKPSTVVYPTDVH